MQCPSCGGEISADKRFCQLVVCEYCQAAVILDKEALRVAGKMSLLAETPSPLYVGGSGMIGSHRFQVMGRVRYGYTNGYWDEWFILWEDGEQAWISEDEDKLTLESCMRNEESPVDYNLAEPGATIAAAGMQLHVNEKDVAICEGGEGQLPFPIVKGEKVPFLDLTSEDEFFTIEYEADGVTVFRGAYLDPQKITMDMTAEEAGASGKAGMAAERAKDEEEDLRERIVRRDDRTLIIRCNNCGVSLRLQGGSQTASVVCSHCKTQLRLMGEKAGFLASLANQKRPPTPFQLGQECNLKGTSYLLVGRICYEEIEEGMFYYSDELLLLDQQRKEYSWLLMENGHFSITHEVKQPPKGILPYTLSPKSKINFQGRTWQVFESGKEKIIWVEGELPWVAKAGDRSEYMSAINPPYVLNAEWTEREMEWFISEYVSREEIAEAFGMALSDLPSCKGIAPNQPFVVGEFQRQSKYVLLGFGAIFLLLALLAMVSKGTQVASFFIPPDQYISEYLSPSFTIHKRNALCEARFRANADNSWVYLDAAVIDEQEQAQLDMSAELSYYHGVEGGESWSEGSQKCSVPFKLKKPGRYQLLVFGRGGAGDYENVPKDSVTITIYENIMLMRYYLCFAVLCLGYVIFEWIRPLIFEARRWQASDYEPDD